MGTHLSNKYGQSLFDSATKSMTDAIKTVSTRAIQKTAEATGNLIGNKIADKVSRAPKTSQKNNWETNLEEILREIFMAPELRYKIINDLRLKEKICWKLFVDLILI